MQPLNDEQLAALRAWPSPAISNAIETFQVRARNYGAMTPDIRCHFPEMEPIVGYAVTCKIRASVPPDQDPEVRVERGDWYDHIESIPTPRIVVIEDLDDPPIGSFWGEVNANIHRAFGCVGVVTSGGVRDMEEVRELGFQFLAKEVLVSHAYVHQVEVGGPVTVGASPSIPATSSTPTSTAASPSPTTSPLMSPPPPRWSRTASASSSTTPSPRSSPARA